MARMANQRPGPKQGSILGPNPPENVPVLAIKKARNGTVKLRNAGYLLLPINTPSAPAAVPIRPPPTPPIMVALHT